LQQNVPFVALAKSLARTVIEPKKLGFIACEFDARLALGEIEVQSKVPGATTRLNQLQRDANAKGFVLVARKPPSILGHKFTQDK
jgi:hypothetical protein